MADPASAQRSAPNASSGRWFQKDGGSPTDKIPVFRSALAEVARAWTESFVALAAVEGEVFFEEVQVCKVDEVLIRRGMTSVLAVLEAPGWNTAVGLNFDRVFVTTMVEALFGGGNDEIENEEASPLSPVNLSIADVIAKQVADALAAGFAKRLPSAFHFDRVQLKLDTSFLGKPTATVVVGTLMLATLGATVRLDVLVPLAAMMVFAEELADDSEPEQPNMDERWTRQLETEVGRASMVLTACVDLDPITLGFITALHEGQLIPLPSGAVHRIRLLCGGDDLFRCDLGQSAGFYTVRIDEAVGSINDQAGDR